MNYTRERYSNEIDWLNQRLTGIGSSDAGALIGFNLNRGRYSVWVNKTTEPEKPDHSDDMALWGHLSESACAKMFMMRAKITDLELQDPGEYTIFRRKDNPTHYCTPDRLLMEKVRRASTTELEMELVPRAVVECKNAYYDQARIWQREVPANYIAQINWQMYVMDLGTAYVACWLDCGKFVWHRVRRHQRLIDRMIKAADEFWETNVKGNQPPAADATAATSRALARKYADPTPTLFELPEEFDSFGTAYDELCGEASRIDKEKTEMQNRLKAAMGNNELALLKDGSGFAWKGSNGSRRFSRKKKVRVPDGQ